MMRWWLDRGVDGFRMDVINFIAKPVACPTPARPRAISTATRRRLYANGPRLHEFPAGDAPRGVRRVLETALLTVGETPATSVERGPAADRPGPR